MPLPAKAASQLADMNLLEVDDILGFTYIAIWSGRNILRKWVSVWPSYCSRLSTERNFF